MSEKQSLVVRPRRRSREEVEHLVGQYETSKLSRPEFCRQHALPVTTLDYYRHRVQMWRQAGAKECRILEVDVAGRGAVRGPAGLAVVLSQGRRIDVDLGFDAATLEQLVQILERL
jgi:hypothetical protein